MRLILFSYPKYFAGESEIIVEVLRKYPHITFHLRKTEGTKEDCMNLLNQIPNNFHKQIVVHYFFEVSNYFQIKGLHFKSTDLQNLHQWKQKMCSTSTHSLFELQNLVLGFEYYFLSPIFPSISKKGYRADFNFREIKKFTENNPQKPLIALGGIDENKLEQCSRLGFAGVGLLGAVWQQENLNTQTVLNSLDTFCKGKTDWQ